MHYLYLHLEKLLSEIVLWQQPTQSLLSKYFQANPKLGSKERHLLSQAIYQWLRYRNTWQLAIQQTTALEQLNQQQQLALALLNYVAKQADSILLQFIHKDLTAVQLAWLSRVFASRDSINPQKANYDLPQWLLTELQQQLSSDELMLFTQHLEQPRYLDIRANLLKIKPKKLIQSLQQQQLQAQQMAYSPVGVRILAKPQLDKLACYKNGELEVQDEGSQLIAILVAAKRDEIVVDYCAGAGGKTLAIGAMLHNTGHLYAFDTASNRLAAFTPRLQRSGITNIYTKVLTNDKDEILKKLTDKVDRVLVDAPCSGTGTLRRFPDLKWCQKAIDIEQLVEQQRTILGQAARLVKPGGSLIYATCSLLRQENEQQAENFSNQFPEFIPVDVEHILQKQQVKNAEQLCTDSNGVQYLRLWPHRHNTDGFFAAVWLRAK